MYQYGPTIYIQLPVQLKQLDWYGNEGWPIKLPANSVVTLILDAVDSPMFNFFAVNFVAVSQPSGQIFSVPCVIQPGTTQATYLTTGSEGFMQPGNYSIHLECTDNTGQTEPEIRMSRPIPAVTS
jgi:hypothetical protein